MTAQHHSLSLQGSPPCNPLSSAVHAGSAPRRPEELPVLPRSVGVDDPCQSQEVTAQRPADDAFSSVFAIPMQSRQHPACAFLSIALSTAQHTSPASRIWTQQHPASKRTCAPSSAVSAAMWSCCGSRAAPRGPRRGATGWNRSPKPFRCKHKTFAALFVALSSNISSVSSSERCAQPWLCTWP